MTYLPIAAVDNISSRLRIRIVLLLIAYLITVPIAHLFILAVGLSNVTVPFIDYIVEIFGRSDRTKNYSYRA